MSPRLEQVLLDLCRREYAVVLLTLGQAVQQRPLPNIQHHHLIGDLDHHLENSEAWDAIQTVQLV